MAIKKFEKLVLSISAKGFPCLWENGGKLTNEFGQAFVVADKHAKPKKPLYVRNNPKPNSGHALIPVREHDIVVVCKIKDEVSTIQLYSISKIDLEQKVAYVDIISSFENGEWTAVPNTMYSDVIDAVISKAKTENCVNAFYILEQEKQEVK